MLLDTNNSHSNINQGDVVNFETYATSISVGVDKINKARLVIKHLSHGVQ